jgi:hypothetical protein
VAGFKAEKEETEDGETFNLCVGDAKSE